MALKRELSAIVAAPVQWGRPLSELTSFRIGGPAEAVVTVTARDELLELTGFLIRHELRWRVIGKGSNLLVADEGFPGVAILLEGEFSEIRHMSERSPVLEVGAGCSLHQLVAYCRRCAFSGMEFLIGIPGSVGGALVMNAGAWGSCMGEVVQHAELMKEGVVRTCTREELAFAYRKTHGLADDDIVLAVTLQLERSAGNAIRKRCEELLATRNARQPKGFANAGSIFKNPENDSAGRLIDACGLKGMRIGDAMISEQHANFIVNCGRASAADVRSLMEKARAAVLQQHGILLESEVHVLC